MSDTGKSMWFPVLIILCVLAIGSFLMLSWGGYGYMGPWMMGGWYGGWWMPAMMLVFWVIVGVGAYLIYRSWAPRGRMETSPAEAGGAFAIAKERLARGEITAEEYEKIRKTLEG